MATESLFKQFIAKWEQKISKEKIPAKHAEIVLDFIRNYVDLLSNKKQEVYEKGLKALDVFLSETLKQFKTPFQFEVYHEKITSPLNYHALGKEVIRPLVEESLSTIGPNRSLETIDTLVQKGENAILFANHQIEADPQALFLLLENTFPRLADSLVFIAGARVTTDPLAIPMSMGCNLICIYSKRYIDHPPEKKHEKQLHNQKAMKALLSLLNEGGHCIYVAPSGGRDRKINGEIRVAPFDPQSIEMFSFLQKKAKKKTHTFGLSLSTYSIMPPPETIQSELGEMRQVQTSPIHAYISDEIQMDKMIDSSIVDKIKKREERAQKIWEIVNRGYQKITS